MGLKRLFKVHGVLKFLQLRGTISDEDYSAMSYIYSSRSNQELLGEIYEQSKPRTSDKRAMARILTQPGYQEEIQRKLNNHVIPFAEKTSICHLLMQTAKQEARLIRKQNQIPSPSQTP